LSQPDPGAPRPSPPTTPLSPSAPSPLADTLIPAVPPPDSETLQPRDPDFTDPDEPTLPPSAQDPQARSAGERETQARSASEGPTQARSASEGPTQARSASEGNRAGQTGRGPASIVIPGYEVLGELGRGGMGVVYKARQVKANRLVALKMILAGSHASADELERFQVEAEAVARLRHPNIIQVFEVGEHEGKPFFSLEFCGGGSLETKLRGTPLPPTEAAGMVETLARAMQAAHDLQVIHRDLKPANVLLLEDGTPRVTDFGLAKKLDEAGRTASGAIMGTPSYMAPEQAGGKSKEIGPAADIYALGAILYDCLTGRPPFKAATAMDTVLQVISDDPVAPSRLAPRCPRDLETICLKCLRKEPGKRYPSAGALAEDLRRFQAGEPITARPVGRMERGWRWCKRNPGVATLAVALVLVATVGFGLVTWKWLDAAVARDSAAQAAEEEKRARKDALLARDAADEQRHRAEAALERAEGALYLNRVRQAEQVARAGDRAAAERILDECRLDLRRWEWNLLRRGRLDGLVLRELGMPVNGLGFNQAGNRLATGSADGKVRVWDTTGKLLTTLSAQKNPVQAVALRPDGHMAVTGGKDGVLGVWDIETGKEIRRLEGHTDQILTLTWSPDGKWIGSGSKDFTAMLWPVAGGEPRTLGGHGKPVSVVAFSPDMRLVVTADLDGILKLWQMADGRLLRTLRGHQLAVLGAGFSADGKEIFSGSLDGTIRVWATETGQTKRTLRGDRGMAAVGLGRTATVSGTQVKIRELVGGQEVLTLRGPEGATPQSLTFSPDGLCLAVAWHDGRKLEADEVRLWDATPPPERFTIHPDSVAGPFSRPACCLGQGPQAQGRRFLATGGLGLDLQSGSAQLWDTATGLSLLTVHGHAAPITSLAFRPDGRQFATASADCTLMVWETVTGKELQTIIGHRKPVLNATWSPDGHRIASVAADGRLCLSNPEKGIVVLTLPNHDPRSPALAYDSEGKRIAAVSGNGELVVHDAVSGSVLVSLPGAGTLTAVAFGPDGRLATAGPGNRVRLWDLEARKAVLEVKPASDPLRQVSLTRNELSVLTRDGTMQTWNVQDGRLLKTRTYPVGERSVALTADDRFLVIATGDGKVQVWDRK
jgi:eukaryotic-like serine/threonine-protein kinase